MSQADVEADATAALLLHLLGWPEARQPVVEGVAMPTPVVPLSGGARGDEEQMRRKEYKKPVRYWCSTGTVPVRYYYLDVLR